MSINRTAYQGVHDTTSTAWKTLILASPEAKALQDDRPLIELFGKAVTALSDLNLHLMRTMVYGETE
jgi:hypothetical protein